MNDGFDLTKVVPWLLTGLAGLVAWFCSRAITRYDDRISVIERTYVSTSHLDRVLDQMRGDREAMHRENIEQLTRIEAKIDANEERASKTRHDTKDEVHALALKMAVNGFK